MHTTKRTLAILAAAFGLGSGLVSAQPPGQALPEGIRGGSEITPADGVEIRSYRFEETGEDLPYSVFVSSKIAAGEKAPLIIALRGFTGTTLTFVRGTAVDLAEEGGYILAGAIGYNNRAGYGIQPRARAGGPPPAAAPAPRAGGPAAAGGRGAPPLVGGSAETDPVRVTEYSEKDVMNVLELVRNEFDVDDRRIYLMGHSQGGGGARHLAEKYADVWAAVALIAPALFDAELTADSAILDLPVMVAVGDQDSLMASSRAFSEQLDALGATYRYEEYAGIDHGTIIMTSQPEVFEFFGEHTRAAE
jgi:pimeloyl-ACP methyl ester carboxylesterase